MVSIPTPNFKELKKYYSLSSRKEQNSRAVAPKAPNVRSCPVSRIRRRTFDDVPKPVSFRDDSNSTFISDSPYYSVDRGSYLSQCYEVCEVLGRGSFGEVMRVISKENGQAYACKRTLFKYRGDIDRNHRLEEVKKHEQLPPHENCIKFYRAWEENNHLFLLTELCKDSLADIFDRGNLTEAKLWELLRDILQGLNHLHANYLIHMDIRPENIFVGFDGKCRIGDFGLVVDFSKGLPADAVEGDPKYLAPECLRNVFTPAADLFSLGVVMLEGAAEINIPRQGPMWHHLRQGYEPEIPGISTQLQDIIKSLLAADPYSRPPAHSLLSRLQWFPSVYYRKKTLEYFAEKAKSLSLFVSSTLWFILQSPNHILNWFPTSKSITQSHNEFKTPICTPANLSPKNLSPKSLEKTENYFQFLSPQNVDDSHTFGAKSTDNAWSFSAKKRMDYNEKRFPLTPICSKKVLRPLTNSTPIIPEKIKVPSFAAFSSDEEESDGAKTFDHSLSSVDTSNKNLHNTYTPDFSMTEQVKALNGSPTRKLRANCQGTPKSRHSFHGNIDMGNQQNIERNNVLRHSFHTVDHVSSKFLFPSGENGISDENFQRNSPFLPKNGYKDSHSPFIHENSNAPLIHKTANGFYDSKLKKSANLERSLEKEFSSSDENIDCIKNRLRSAGNSSLRSAGNSNVVTNESNSRSGAFRKFNKRSRGLFSCPAVGNRNREFSLSKRSASLNSCKSDIRASRPRYMSVDFCLNEPRSSEENLHIYNQNWHQNYQNIENHDPNCHKLNLNSHQEFTDSQEEYSDNDLIVKSDSFENLYIRNGTPKPPEPLSQESLSNTAKNLINLFNEAADESSSDDDR